MPKLAVIVVVATVFSACATHHPARNHLKPSDWSAVLALSDEEHIEVTTKDGKRTIGTVQSANPQEIVVSPRSVILRREDVLSVWVLGREDSALNGTLIGAVAGVAVGFTANVDGNSAFAISVIGAVVGGGLGAWLDNGWKGPPRRLIYTAPSTSGQN